MENGDLKETGSDALGGGRKTQAGVSNGVQD